MVKTNRLVLRRLKLDDGQLLLDFYKKNEAFFKPYEPVKLKSFYQLAYQENAIKAEKSKEEQGRSIKFLMFRKEEPDQLLGLVTLNEIVKGCFLSCFMGYKMDQSYINQGYMTEAVKAVSEYAFDVMRLHRIEANVMPRNKASLQVAEKAGFVNEGTSKQYLKINGVWEDHIHMVKLNLERPL